MCFAYIHFYKQSNFFIVFLLFSEFPTLISEFSQFWHMMSFQNLNFFLIFLK